MIFASLATPENPIEPLSFPTAMPATCVPCSHSQVSEVLQFTPEPAAVDSDTPPGQSEVAVSGE